MRNRSTRATSVTELKSELAFERDLVVVRLERLRCERWRSRWERPPSEDESSSDELELEVSLESLEEGEDGGACFPLDFLDEEDFPERDLLSRPRCRRLWSLLSELDLLLELELELEGERLRR